MADDTPSKSYQQPRNRIKESPLHTTPKEIKPGYYIFSPGLTAPAGGRARVRERWLKRKTAAAVEEALVAFHGTRGPKPSDEASWARFAWDMGYGTLREAIYQAQSEIAEHTKPVPLSDYPKVLQNVLNKRWRKRKGKRAGKGGAR